MKLNRLFLWCNLFRQSSQSSAKRAPFRPVLEPLEDRLAPANTPAYLIGQWASSVLDYSSQYSPGTWSAQQALGAPNTLDYGDYSTAWAPSSANGSTEWLTLEFETATVATGVVIRETYGNGFVSRVDLIDTENVSHQVWEGTDPSEPGTGVNFTIRFAATSYRVQAVKIYIDTDRKSGWEEIDAVRLLGPEAFSRAADLAVVAGTARSANHLSLGGKVKVNWKVKNLGGTSAAPLVFSRPFWTDQVYLSADAQLDASDLMLGSQAYAGRVLARGRFYRSSLVVTLPSDFAWAGRSAYLLVQADTHGNILEANVANNIRAIPIRFNPFVALQSPTLGHFVDPNTPLQFETLVYDGQRPSVVDIAVDRDANPRNGATRWVATDLPVSNQGGTVSVTAALTGLAPRTAPYYVWARLRQVDTGEVMYSLPVRLAVASVAERSEDALGDYVGNSSYEVFGIDAARFGRRLHFRVRTNFAAGVTDEGGDIRLVIGGQTYGLAVNTHKTSGGAWVIRGHLYAGTTFLGGKDVPSVPTFIDTFTSHVARCSTVRVVKMSGRPWLYEIEGSVDLAALSGYDPGDQVQVSWAMYCGNDTDEVTIQPEESDFALLAAELGVDETLRYGYEARGEIGEVRVALYLSRDNRFDPLVDQLVDAQTITPSAYSSGQGTFDLKTRLNRSAPYLLVVADPWSVENPGGDVTEANERGNNLQAISIRPITAKLVNGKLIVTGTEFNDSVRVVLRDDSTIVVETGGATTTTANIPIQLGRRPREFVYLAQVKSIRMYGDKGDDTLKNQTNQPSYMDGGQGNDQLYGGSGSDGLFGGLGPAGNPEVDILEGEGGLDRFYSYTDISGGTKDEVRKTSDEARFLISDTWVNGTLPDPDPDLQGIDNAPVAYKPAAWTAAEVEALDDVLVLVQTRTNNAVLLKPYRDRDVTFWRVEEFTTNQSGYNRGGAIYLPDSTMSHQVLRLFTIIHELGHFHDNESSRWEDFQALSGWEFGLSDGKWHFQGNPRQLFLRDYGGQFPYEDFADTFAIAVLYKDRPNERMLKRLGLRSGWWGRNGKLMDKWRFMKNHLDNL